MCTWPNGHSVGLLMVDAVALDEHILAAHVESVGVFAGDVVDFREPDRRALTASQDPASAVVEVTRFDESILPLIYLDGLLWGDVVDIDAGNGGSHGGRRPASV